MKLTLVLLLLGAAALPAATITYQVTVDTTGFAGQNARADFQFNPGGVPDLATMALSNLFGVGSTSEVSRVGGVTGTGPWTFSNSAALNQLVLNLVTLSNLFSFTITFSGDVIDNPSSFDATSFFFTLLDAAGSAPLGNFTQPSLWLDVTGGSAFVTSQDQPITVTEVSSAVPEPGSAALLLSALALGWGWRRIRSSAGA